jgi:hypothetical protein
MKVKLDLLSEKDYIISPREVAGEKVTLVCPTKGKHQWSENELHLRSILCSADGEIISSGFPKFFNYGENKDVDQSLIRAIAAGRVTYSEKLDGSLIIRDIINGNVVFRTRGSHNLGSFEEPVMTLIKEKYPILLDSNFGSTLNCSMLFEFISPDNKIIVSYSKPEIYFLGAMILFHGDLKPKFYPANTFGKLSEKMGVPVPPTYKLSGSVQSIVDHIGMWEGSEGVVVNILGEDGDTYSLVKIKCREYVKLHSLRYHLSESKIQQICWAGDIQSEESLRLYLANLGLDWEMTSFVTPIVKSYLEKRRQREGEISKFLNDLEVEGLTRLVDKRDIALALKELWDDDTKFFAMGLWYLSGNTSRFEDTKWSYLIDIPVRSVSEYLKEGRLILSKYSKGNFD